MPARSLVVAVTAAGLALVAPAANAFADYPPPVDSHGEGTADPSRVGIGDCTTFAGGGFGAGAELAITDQGAEVSTIHADRNGDFSTRVCFNSGAHPGRHVLEASGTGASGEHRTVDASVVVQGGSESSNGQHAGSAGQSGSSQSAPGQMRKASSSHLLGLPLTPFNTLVVIVAGLLVLAVGSMALLVGEVRYRRLRRRRASMV